MRYTETGIGPSSSPELKQHTAALVRVHKKMETIAKKKENPHFRSRYADLATICNELVGLLTEEGFAMPTYHTGWYGAEMGWCCLGVLKHDSGEWTSTLVPLINLPRKTREGESPADMQGLGSAKTYAKRYCLLDLVGAWVGEADDDGNRASGRTQDSQPGRQTEGDPAKAMAYEASAKKAIVEAATEADAQKHLDTVRLRAKEKAITPDVFRRCEAEFTRKWKTHQEA